MPTKEVRGRFGAEGSVLTAARRFPSPLEGYSWVMLKN